VKSISKKNVNKTHGAVMLMQHIKYAVRNELIVFFQFYIHACDAMGGEEETWSPGLKLD
jgi:hypothetical protein